MCLIYCSIYAFLSKLVTIIPQRAQRKPTKAWPKKPQVVLGHARTPNVKLSFLSTTSVAKVLTKSGSSKTGFKCN